MTVAVSMSAVWMTLATILCLSSRSLTAAPETNQVVWKENGGAFTIQCDSTKSDQNSLDVRKGLNKGESVIYYYNTTSDKKTISSNFTARLQVNGKFPKLDIRITNLTSADTGPYWCIYKGLDGTSLITTEGTGSVLLLVTDKKTLTCSPEMRSGGGENLVLVSVVISAAVLLCFMIVVFIWLIKTKTSNTAAKPRHIPNNDVYEDMRGTIRR